MLAIAERDNNHTYRPVLESGLGELYCLGHEVFGRWGRQAVKLLPLLARERARGMHPRLRRGTALSYLTRWSGLIAIGFQKAVATAVLRDTGADLLAYHVAGADAASRGVASRLIRSARPWGLIFTLMGGLQRCSALICNDLK